MRFPEWVERELERISVVEHKHSWSVYPWKVCIVRDGQELFRINPKRLFPTGPRDVNRFPDIRSLVAEWLIEQGPPGLAERDDISHLAWI